MTMLGEMPPRVPRSDLEVNNELHPDWIAGNVKPVVVGDTVLCVAGLARVTKVCGKTGDGSRLLELELAEGDKKHPFFAAASNVRVQP